MRIVSYFNYSVPYKIILFILEVVMSKSKKKRVILNVSGETFETLEQTLQRYPDTLLGNLNKIQDHFCVYTNEYFFNRSRNCFEAILFFYQSNGRLSRPPNVQMDIFEKECQFYELPKTSIESMKRKEGIIPDKPEDFTEMDQPLTLQLKAWKFIEVPDTFASGAFTVFSLLLVICSIVTTCIETLPSLKVISTNMKNPWFVIELSLNSWFLFEVVLKLICCPSKLKFFKSTLNWIDIITVIPYFISYALNGGQDNSLGVLRIFRLLRIIRLFRLSKHSKQINLVGKIIKDSLSDFHLFLLCLMIIVIFGGSLLYFMEHTQPNSPFTSIPEGIWCALQTIVTLGYGDIIPETVIGKLFLSLFMVFGALTISLPVLSIVIKFTSQYSLEKK